MENIKQSILAEYAPQEKVKELIKNLEYDIKDLKKRVVKEVYKSLEEIFIDPKEFMEFKRNHIKEINENIDKLYKKYHAELCNRLQRTKELLIQEK